MAQRIQGEWIAVIKWADENYKTTSPVCSWSSLQDYLKGALLSRGSVADKIVIMKADFNA